MLTVENAQYSVVITLILQGLKAVGLDSKFCPILSWVLGAGISIGFTSGNYVLDIINGVLLGSMAMGLYESGKFTINETKKLL